MSFQGAHWWSVNDYEYVVKMTRRLGARRVLEFGPGASTLSLLEGGAERIDCCETDRHWLNIYSERLQFPQVVLHSYALSDPLSVPSLDGQRWDMALIDGPREVADRFPVVHYCLARCAHVLVPLESIGSDAMTRFVFGLDVTTIETMETGPLAGSFALLTA
jgi:hypothetical protein